MRIRTFFKNWQEAIVGKNSFTKNIKSIIYPKFKILLIKNNVFSLTRHD